MPTEDRKEPKEDVENQQRNNEGLLVINLAKEGNKPKISRLCIPEK